MKDILDKLSQIEASAPELQKKKVLKESAAPVQTKPTTLKDLFYQLDEGIAPGQKPLPVMDPTNKQAGMGFVTSPDPAVQNMLKNLDPKDVQIVQAPGTQSTQPTQQQQSQPAAAGATGQAPAGQTQMKEKFAGNVKLNPAKKGMFKGKTKAELEKQLSALHKSGPHKKGSPEYTKQQELNFAIRAKSGWKKSVEEEQLDELSPEAKWDYADKARKSVNDLAGKVGSATGQDANKLINKAIKRQNIVRKTERNLIDVDEAHTGDEAEKKFNKYNAQELGHMHDRAFGKSKPGDAHKQMRTRQAKDAAYNIMWKKKYGDLDEADIAPTSGMDTKGAGLGAGRSATTLEAKKAKPDFLDLDKDGNKKESMKKAASDKQKKAVKENMNNRIQAARLEGKAHGLKGHPHCGKNYDDMEECRAYHEGYKEGLDECHGMTPIAGLHTPHMPATVHGMADQALDEGRGSYNAVMDAIRHRILRSHVDLVGKFGPGKIMAAIEDQARFYDSIDLDEIGSSDVSIWVRNVIQDLESGHYDYLDEEDSLPLMNRNKLNSMANPAFKDDMEEGNAFTAALAKTPKGGHFKVGGKTFTDNSNYDSKIDEYAFEAWDRQLENLINEGLSVSISKDNANMPDSVSVNATDQEADKLLSLVRQAGMGIFGGEDEAGMSHAPVIGGASEVNAPGEIEVVDDHDGMMSLIKKMSDIGGGDHQEDYDDGDYADEKDGACEECGHSPCGCNDEEEMSEAQCNECGMMESQCGCNEEVLDEVESEDQMEYEVAEDQAQAPQGAQNPPDNGSANSSNDTAGNNAANSALATADQTDQPEMAESKECTECHCDPCECDDEEDPRFPHRHPDDPRGGDEDLEESFSFQNVYKKFAMIESKGEDVSEGMKKNIVQAVVASVLALGAGAAKADVIYSFMDPATHTMQSTYQKAQVPADSPIIIKTDTDTNQTVMLRGPSSSTSDQPAASNKVTAQDILAIGRGVADVISAFKGRGDDRSFRGDDHYRVRMREEEDLTEWANDAGPGKTVSDTTFEQDIDFMTKVISGGLNKQKSTGQTTVPVVATQLNRLHSHDTTDINESLLDWKKLAGL